MLNNKNHESNSALSMRRFPAADLGSSSLSISDAAESTFVPYEVHLPVSSELFERTALEKEVIAFIAETIRSVDTQPIKSGKTILVQQGEKTWTLSVTNTIKLVDDALNNKDVTIQTIADIFQASAAKINLLRGRRAKTLYSSLSDPVQAYLIKRALKKIINVFKESITEKDVSWTFFKTKYTIDDVNLYLPSTAAKILTLYEDAESALNGVTWQYALQKTQQLLIDNYCSPEQTSYRSPFRSDNVKRLYCHALDVLQAEYHVEYTAYYFPDFMANLAPDKFEMFLGLYAGNRIQDNLPLKTKIEADIEAIKGIFFEVQDNDQKKLISTKFKALEYLAYRFFEYAAEIPIAERNSSPDQLYRLIILTIAKYQCYNLQALDEQEREVAMATVETKMKNERAYYQGSAERFEAEKSRFFFISSPAP